MVTDLDDTSAVDDSDADPDFIPSSCESFCSDYYESDVNKKRLRKHLNQRRLPPSRVLHKKINRNNTVAKKVNYVWNRSNLRSSRCLKTLKAVNYLNNTSVDFDKSYVDYDKHYNDDHSTVFSSSNSVVSASTKFINKHSTSVTVSDTSGYCSAIDTESSYYNLNNLRRSKRKKKMSSLSSISLLPSTFMESCDDGDENDGDVSDNDSMNISIDTDINVDRVMEVHDNRTFINSEIVEKFSDLNIEITWDLPLSHSHQNSLRWDHNDLNETMQINGDKFSESEDNIIVRNWAAFKSIYGFEDPTLFFQGYIPKNIFRNRQKKRFVQFLSRDLTNRTLRSVYNRFNILFASEFNSIGRFSYREDRILLEMNKIPENLIGGQKRKSKIVQTILRRKGLTISRRWSSLKKADPSSLAKPLKWSLKFSSKLVRLLLRHKNCNNVEELIAAVIPDKMWYDIAHEMKCGSGGRLKSYWLNQLSVQLSCKEPVYRNRLRSELIMWFHQRIDKLHNWKEIKWIKVSNYFKLSPFFLFRKFRNMVMKYVPVVKIDNLRDCVMHLHEVLLPLLNSGKFKDCCLRRLKFIDNRKLIEVD